jgi:nitrogen regulatory protein PII
MTPCKRIEIIIEEALARRLEEKLQALGAPGYTFIPRAGGAGDRGLMRGDDPTGAASNCVFIVVVDDDDTARLIVEGVQPFLTRSGGVCLVSDALWLGH